MTAERTIATTTHGRYLADIVSGTRGPLLVGFHGYAERCSVQFERLRDVRGSSSMSLVAVQGLHRFYRSGGEEVAASWMTREDRELAIADNILYVDRVLDEVVSESQEPSALVFTGFSQGASMAYRAAALGARTASGVIALGGDVPPDLPIDALARIPRVLIGWGVRDPFYGSKMREADERRLAEAGVPVSVVEHDAAHEWTEAFTRAAADWLNQIE